MDGLESLSRPFLLLNVLLSYADDVVHTTGDNIDLWLPSICIVIGQWTLDIPGPQIATNTPPGSDIRIGDFNTYTKGLERCDLQA